MKLFQTEKDKMCERIAEGLANLVSHAYHRYEKSIQEINPNFSSWQTFGAVIKNQLRSYGDKSYNNKDYLEKILEYFADNLLKITDCEIKPEIHAYIIYQNTAPKKASILKEIIPRLNNINGEEFDLFIKKTLKREY